jgi:ribosome maturation factor RimP
MDVAARTVVRRDQTLLGVARGREHGGIGIRGSGRPIAATRERDNRSDRSARNENRASADGRHRAESATPVDYPGREHDVGPTREEREVRMSSAVSRDRLRELLAPVVSAAGFDLEDVAVTAAGRRQLVRVVVARDGGLDLDAVAEVSRVVSATLDDSDATGATPYTLEVTSPGVDRPLTQPRHWQRARGRLVKAAHGVTGRVLDADDDVVRLDVDGETREIPYADLGTGHVQVEFS